MKSLFIKFSIVLIVLVIGLTSCSKDDDGTPPSPPTTAELLAHKWFLVKSENLSTPPTEVIADACEQTTYINFLADGSLIFEAFGLDMGSNCVQSFLTSFTYILGNNGEQITITDGMAAEIWPIQTLTETELVLTFSNRKFFFER